MESAFACKVFNQYGSREIPNIACECRYGNQHVFTDMVYLESIHEDGADKLIVTALTNRTMPFIRYDIGDSGTLKAGDCPCGSPFPMMAMGVCRSNDLIKTRSGKTDLPLLLHPSARRPGGDQTIPICANSHRQNDAQYPGITATHDRRTN